MQETFVSLRYNNKQCITVKQSESINYTVD